MKLLAFIGSFLLPTLLIANPIEGEQAVHDAAHFGASYAVTHATEVLCTKLAGKDNRLTCTIVGVATSLAAGALKESMDGAGDNHMRGFIANGAGIGLAATLIYFDW